ncbi:MAG: hypothetical protein COW05_02005 [Gammaproteobacteria bacterium CG12_big_fil_rev_8_21_14_0_65_46_12]|nr:MAG: hypothetical protein COW05_02005 [Gammaproteobacteria bacterium CG12_big_fil_rev_8_21_14_0_65_46_12]
MGMTPPRIMFETPQGVQAAYFVRRDGDVWAYSHPQKVEEDRDGVRLDPALIEERKNSETREAFLWYRQEIVFR